MKILYGNDYFERSGGAEIYLFRLAELMKKKGHETYIFATSREHQIKNNNIFIYKEAKNVIIRYILLNYFNPWLYHAFRQWLIKINPDIIHLHNTNKYLFAILLAAKREKIPVVRTVHDFRIVCPTMWSVKPNGNICDNSFGIKCPINNCVPFRFYAYSFLPWKIRNLLIKNGIDLLIAPSIALFKKMKSNGFKNVIHLPNFGEHSNSDNICKNTEKKNILYVGGLNDYKGVKYLIAAFPLILEKVPDAKLTIVGSGPDRKYLEILAENLSINIKNIKFKGRISDDELFESYRTSNVVVVPSIWMENSPLVIYEAMKFGNPVVGSNIGGISDLILDGETGYLVEPRNPVQIAGKVIKILNDDNLAQDMGKKARLRLENEFSADKHIKRMLDIYNSLISKNKCKCQSRKCNPRSTAGYI